MNPYDRDGEIEGREEEFTEVKRGNLFSLVGFVWFESHPANHWGFVKGKFTLALDLNRLTLWFSLKRVKLDGST